MKDTTVYLLYTIIFGRSKSVIFNELQITSSDSVFVFLQFDGGKTFTISAAGDFSGSNMVELATAGKTLTFKDVTLDGNDKCRVIKASAGSLVLNDTVVTGGKSKSYVRAKTAETAYCNGCGFKTFLCLFAVSFG